MGVEQQAPAVGMRCALCEQPTHWAAQFVFARTGLPRGKSDLAGRGVICAKCAALDEDVLQVRAEGSFADATRDTCEGEA